MILNYESNNKIVNYIEQIKNPKSKIMKGDYIVGIVESSTPRTLFCKPLFKTSIS